MKDVLAQAKREGFEDITFIEGESLRFPKFLFDAIDEARSRRGGRRIGLGYIASNASFATSVAAAVKVLRQVKKRIRHRELRGKENAPVFFSLDPLHQEWTPFERVVNAIKASRRVFPGKDVVIYPMPTPESGKYFELLLEALRPDVVEDAVLEEGEKDKDYVYIPLKDGVKVKLMLAGCFYGGRAVELSARDVLRGPMIPRELTKYQKTPLLTFDMGGEYPEVLTYVDLNRKMYPHPDHATSNILCWGRTDLWGLDGGLWFANHDPVVKVLADDHWGLPVLEEAAARFDSSLQGTIGRCFDPVHAVNTLLANPQVHLNVTEYLQRFV